ncbi:hypothetical protein [Dickeya poaceiphila]|uniref:hypothetical protein n=1 Tax=Dickeya poaceiphila TaxID=568768 RepID=UPI00039BD304|nr:hypothetical protein [Dickeya poaceiphila]
MSVKRSKKRAGFAVSGGAVMGEQSCAGCMIWRQNMACHARLLCVVLCYAPQV